MPWWTKLTVVFQIDAEYARRHKSIIAYLSAHDLPETASALRNELGMAETDFDATAVKKYETLLEKKWTSTVRLQKKASQNCGSVCACCASEVFIAPELTPLL